MWLETAALRDFRSPLCLLWVINGQLARPTEGPGSARYMGLSPRFARAFLNTQERANSPQPRGGKGVFIGRETAQAADFSSYGRAFAAVCGRPGRACGNLVRRFPGPCVFFCDAIAAFDLP